MNNTTPSTETPFFFRAIDRYVETHIVSAKETKGRHDRIVWGDGNAYPDYIVGLYKDVATLGSIVNGCVDYTAGNDVRLDSGLFPEGKVNNSGEIAEDIVRGAALDYFLFGGFALEVVRSADGKVAEIYNMDMECLRTNDDVNVFWWSDKWKTGGRDAKELPAFMSDVNWATLTEDEQKRVAHSVLYVKNTRKQVYPLPPFAQAVTSCETERAIDVFHLNSIKNGFAADVMIEFCNGNPSDKVKEEIERNLNEKHGGETNAGRMFISYSPDRLHSAIITPFKIEDFGNRYDALAKRCRQQIFTSFRANPNLFGIPTESNGFNAEEYAEAFKLFNRTQIQPVQKRIAEAFAKVLGPEGGTLTIVPFSMEEARTRIVA